MIRALALCLLASPAQAETPMSGAEFEAYTTGKTLSFGTPGNPDFGTERYLPGRRVLWSTEPGLCTEGKWYARDGLICFVYRGDPEHKCWTVTRTEAGIRADFANVPDSTILFEAQETKPLICGDLLS